MEAPVPQASRELAGRHCHSMGGGAYYCVDPCVCGDMAGKRRHRSKRRIDSIGGEVTGPARNFAGQMAAQVEAEALRAETRRAAADRTLQAQQRQEAGEVATGAIGGGQVTMDEALLLAGPSPETGRAYTQQEFELRERLRLEALERRSRARIGLSLRPSPERSGAVDRTRPRPFLLDRQRPQRPRLIR